MNIGLRHMLIVVPLLAIFTARALATWIESLAPSRQMIAGAAIGLLLAIQAAVVERARPELMAYFNPLAGAEPGHALIDSDLDWGQDMLLLQRDLAARGAKEVHYGLFAILNPCDPAWPAENDPAGAGEAGGRVGGAERAVLPVGAALQLRAGVVRAGRAVPV